MKRLLLAGAIAALAVGCASTKQQQKTYSDKYPASKPVASSSNGAASDMVQEDHGTLALLPDGTWVLIRDNTRPLPIVAEEDTQFLAPSGDKAPFTAFTQGREVRATYEVTPSGVAQLREVQLLEEVPAAGVPLDQLEPGSGAGYGTDQDTTDPMDPSSQDVDPNDPDAQDPGTMQQPPDDEAVPGANPIDEDDTLPPDEGGVRDPSQDVPGEQQPGDIDVPDEGTPRQPVTPGTPPPGSNVPGSTDDDADEPTNPLVPGGMESPSPTAPLPNN